MRLRKIKGAMELLRSHEDIVVLNPTEYYGRWSELFGNSNPINIEIGCGKGKFVYEMAIKNPNINFIAIEKYDSVLIKALRKFINNNIDNVKLVLFDAFELENIFDKEVENLYLNFSDPWPKAKHAKRRLTHANFLKQYKNIINNAIIFKTDNLDLFNYSIESMTDFGMFIVEKTNDLHSLDVENTMTEFEKKFSEQGIKINRLVARFEKDEG
ncbi:tRNA (guanosine(46)-N7)-methyltransferase TrmB [Mycoplasmatota bacterium zrk1]